MEQEGTSYMFHRRPITASHHLLGPHFDYLRLRSRPLSHRPAVESLDRDTYQSRPMHLDEPWTLVSGYTAQ